MANIIEWPWPRVFSTPYRMIAISKIPSFYIYIIAEMTFDGTDWDFSYPGYIEGIGSITDVDVADFGPFYVLSVIAADTPYTYYRDIEEDSEFQQLILQTNLSIGTICNFRGQLVGGRIASSTAPWTNFDTNHIVWCGIGNYEFDPTDDRTAGFKEMFFYNVSTDRAIIHRVLPFGNCIGVYSDSGCVILRPDTVGDSFTYGDSSYIGINIDKGSHVAGDATIHGLISTEKDFWLVSPSGEYSCLGYREWITDLLDTNAQTILNYVPRRKSFYICNGTECLIINQFGAYHSHQLPSSVFQSFDGNLYGVFDDNDDLQARVVTDKLDFGSRGLKSVESLLAGITHDDDSLVSMAVDWRMAGRDDFSRSSFIPGGPTAESAIHVAGLDFRLCLTVSDYTEAYLSYFLANVKYSDQRFKRGTVPTQYQIGEA